jgi:colanic acid biosynthesis glycosyl transferase WcaI
MKILVNDFCGHAFTLQLAVELAQRGHDVDYVYFASEPGPKGNFERARSISKTIRIHGPTIDGVYKKDSFLSRRRFDLVYGKELFKLIVSIGPDVVISGNTPTEVQSYVQNGCRKSKAKFVYWMQDFYSVAATKLLKRKLGPIGAVIGRYFAILDRRHLRRSDRIVLITENFRDEALRMSADPKKIDVIENWGVIDEISRHDRDNKWSSERAVQSKFNFLYSGTLGLKHNPELLVLLADDFRETSNVIVASQGASVPYLKARKAELDLQNLYILPLQPFESLPYMLAAGDIVVATIEPDAGSFSVPSKVLSYLCSGRPILLAAPLDNLAAKIVKEANAGCVVAPDDEKGFLEAARWMKAAKALEEMGENGRAYAEKHFNISKIAARFEDVFFKALNEEGKA